jgi:hypothetical protein
MSAYCPERTFSLVNRGFREIVVERVQRAGLHAERRCRLRVAANVLLVFGAVSWRKLLAKIMLQAVGLLVSEPHEGAIANLEFLGSDLSAGGAPLSFQRADQLFQRALL